MWAFIIAGIIAGLTLVMALIYSAMQGALPAPDDNGTWSILGWGLGIAALIAATHWLPRLGW